MTTQAHETHSFEAEVQKVLELVIHSLYGNREIFLRELVSNASDALDKLRFEALTAEGLMEQDDSLGIALEVDKPAGILRVADNGIGMTREDLLNNLGTIASSGTRRFVESLKEQQAAESPELIGQFGVGFYSAFMVASEVTVETRRAGSDEGWRWHSTGAGEFTIEPAEDLGRGTLITLKLRSAGPDEAADGEDEDASDGEGALEFLEEWRLRELVKRYSDFVEYPIQMEIERTEPVLDDEGKPLEDEEPKTVTSTETLNSMKPLWARPKSEIEETEYHEFYKHVSHDWNEPLETIHFRAEGTLEYTALLYLPKQRGMDLFDPDKANSRISLYVRRVLIQRECEDLLPRWLRFVRGVVESSDLPLNVSRETLQDNPKVKQIAKRLTRKVVDSIGGLLAERREDYESFWGAFGPVLKEGIYYGEDDDQRISKLCLFESTHGEGLTTLAEYIERMPEGQEVIYTLTAPDRKTAESSPLLEGLESKGFEVLFFLDPVDEFAMSRLFEFEGKKLASVDKGDLELEDEDEKKVREEKQKEFEGLLGALQETIDDEVKEVRFSSLLNESPAALVHDAGGMSPQMERMLRAQGQELPKQKRILELNPEHPLVAGLKKIHDVDQSSPRIGDFATVLLGQALLAEGASPPDPARFARLVTDLMVESLG